MNFVLTALTPVTGMAACGVCEADFRTAIKSCAEYHNQDHEKFLDCLTPTLHKITSDDCLAYTLDPDMTGCDVSICQLIEEHMPGVCPEKGVPRPQVVEGKTACGLGPEEGDYADQKFADCINENNGGKWTSSPVTNKTMEAFKRTLGIKMETQIRLPYNDDLLGAVKDDMPTDFDSRTNWPGCAGIIGHVRDQSNCGSCWAHGTTEAFNDRMCITKNFTNLLSVADTTGCCNFISCFSMGCNGGQVATPWNWFHKKGVVTGGDYGDGQLCYDYTMQECAHHVDSKTLPSCDQVTQVDPKCYTSCQSNKQIIYEGDKHESSARGYGFRSTDEIKKDLMTNGPVTAAFTVYSDFPTYSGGVYKHTSGSALGGHAVKIIGWGVEDGDEYWLVMNSWNDSWGLKGLFKIAFGECGIDSQCAAGQA